MRIYKEPVDATGRRIEIGHIIAYPVRHDSIKQAFGIVRDITYSNLEPIIHIDRNSEEVVKEYKQGKVIGWKKYAKLKRMPVRNHELALILPLSEKWYLHHFKINEIIEEHRENS